MRKLMIGLFAFGSISAYAGVKGLPYQDPIVKKLREEFKSASLPGNEILEKKYSCRSYSAGKDMFFKDGDGRTEITFSAFNGFFTLLSPAHAHHKVDFASNGKEISASINKDFAGSENQILTSNFRSINNGEKLINELTGTVHDRSRETSYFYKKNYLEIYNLSPISSYYYDNTRVIEYQLCVRANP